MQKKAIIDKDLLNIWLPQSTTYHLMQSDFLQLLRLSSTISKLFYAVPPHLTSAAYQGLLVSLIQLLAESVCTIITTFLHPSSSPSSSSPSSLSINSCCSCRCCCL